jgi:hypothetical protein
MGDERKPVWTWIAALLIGLPVLYVASFGPACWATTVNVSQAGGPRYHKTMIVYWPLGFVADGDSQVSRILQWWMGLGAPDDGRFTFVPTNPGGTCAAGFRGNAKVSSSNL